MSKKLTLEEKIKEQELWAEQDRYKAMNARRDARGYIDKIKPIIDLDALVKRVEELEKRIRALLSSTPP